MINKKRGHTVEFYFHDLLINPIIGELFPHDFVLQGKYDLKWFGIKLLGLSCTEMFEPINRQFDEDL